MPPSPVGPVRVPLDPSGRISVTITLDRLVLPVLTTVIEYVSNPGWLMVARSTVLVIVRLEVLVIVVVTVV